MSDDKLGTYITKLMTTILDSKQEDFVKQLAMSELNRLNIDISSFLKKHLDSKEEESLGEERKQEKQLLQEEKENGK